MSSRIIRWLNTIIFVSLKKLENFSISSLASLNVEINGLIHVHDGVKYSVRDANVNFLFKTNRRELTKDSPKLMKSFSCDDSTSK